MHTIIEIYSTVKVYSPLLTHFEQPYTQTDQQTNRNKTMTYLANVKCRPSLLSQVHCVFINRMTVM